jgi:hypothetical protein
MIDERSDPFRTAPGELTGDVFAVIVLKLIKSGPRPSVAAPRLLAVFPENVEPTILPPPLV